MDMEALEPSLPAFATMPRDGSSGGERDVPRGDAGLRARLRAIHGEIAALYFALLDERQAATGLAGSGALTNGAGSHTPSLELELDLRRPGRPGPPEDQLYEQVRQAAQRAADRSAVFPRGHVYCYWCRSFVCDHSASPAPRTVFAGYSPTGQPSWRDLGTVLLERGDPRVDILYREEGGLLTLVQSGGELTREQLHVYGKGSPIYRILGQVAVGYLQAPRRHGGAATEPFALTVQAVEAAGGSAAAHLNVLGRAGSGISALQAVEELFDARIADAMAKTRRRLDEIALVGGRSRRRARERTREVMDALRLLAKNLDRIFRQGRRRTRHSQSRHLNRQRPAAVALSDALQARPGAILRDVRQSTWVVLGPKNRVHVFNDDALHVTSVVYPVETVRQRTGRGQWKQPLDAERQAFVERLRERAAHEA